MCFKKTVVFLKHFFAQKVRAFPLRKGVRVARGYVEGVAWYRHDSDIVARARRRGRLPPPKIQKKTQMNRPTCATSSRHRYIYEIIVFILKNAFVLL